MDTCIQMPEELGLSLEATSDRGLLEMGVAVCAMRPLKTGLVLRLEEGKTVLQNLEVFSSLQPDDVRHKFGCTEEVMEVDGRTVRHCNWLRFLRASTDVCRVNVLARLIDTKATFQVVRPIEPRQELLAFFSTEPLESTKGKLVPVLQSSFNEPKLNTLTQKLLLEDPHDIAEHLANNNSTHASIKNDFELSKIFHGKSFHNFQMTPPNHTSHWKESLSSSGYASLTDRAEVENNPFKSPNYLQASTGVKEEIVCERQNEQEHKTVFLEYMENEGESDGSDTEVDVEYTDSDASSLHFSPRQEHSPKQHLPQQKHSPQQQHSPKQQHSPQQLHSLQQQQSIQQQHLPRLHLSPQHPSSQKPPSPIFSTPLPDLKYKPPLLSTPRDLFPETKRRRGGKSWFPCKVCNKKFDRPSLLTRHIRIHTGEKPFECDVCGKAFSTSSSLNTHRRIHSGERPHKCPVCDKRFTASSNLYYHRMTHKKDKPHKCTTCSKSFPTPGDLRTHQYTHSGEWPFVCSVCGRGFSKSANLKNHLFMHFGEPPVQCEACSSWLKPTPSSQRLCEKCLYAEDAGKKEIFPKKTDSVKKTKDDKEEKEDMRSIDKTADKSPKPEFKGQDVKKRNDSLTGNARQKSSIFSIESLVSNKEIKTTRHQHHHQNSFNCMSSSPFSLQHPPPHLFHHLVPFQNIFSTPSYPPFANPPLPSNIKWHRSNGNF